MPAGLTSEWTAGPPSPTLGAGDVHLWSVGLDVDDAELDSLAALLDAGERARAARFRFDQHRRRWIASRAMLRAILSRYVPTPAADIEFTVEPGGKPHLRGDGHGGHVHFNFSHADDVALLGVTSFGPVGVDVERVQPMPDAELIAETHFAPGERERLRRLGPAGIDSGFFSCWTRKEAYIKAVGGGLAMPLDAFEVTLSPDDPPRLVHIGGNESEARQWTLRSVTPAQGFAGAVAVQAPDIQLSCWRLA